MITLWDGYAVDADEYQFILGKPTVRKRKDGTEEQYMASPTYHPRLGSALGRFYNIKVRESSGTTNTPSPRPLHRPPR